MDNDKKLQKLIAQGLPNGKQTKRNALLKLEIAESTVAQKLSAVGKNIYSFDQEVPYKESRTNRRWPVTDDILYKDAKQSYDEIIEAFKQPPKVYKLRSTRETVWKQKDQQLSDEADEAYREMKMREYEEAVAAREKQRQLYGPKAKIPPVPKPHLKRPKSSKAKKESAELSDMSSPIVNRRGGKFNSRNVEVSDDPLQSYLNPFDVDKPWITKRTVTGKLYYINEETGERSEKPPNVVRSVPASVAQLLVFLYCECYSMRGADLGKQVP